MKTDDEVDLILDFIDRHIWEGEHARTPLPKEMALSCEMLLLRSFARWRLGQYPLLSKLVLRGAA